MRLETIERWCDLFGSEEDGSLNVALLTDMRDAFATPPSADRLSIPATLDGLMMEAERSA
jgi:hypothetical protein